MNDLLLQYITLFGSLGIVLSLLLVAVGMRKKHYPNWWVFVVGAVAAFTMSLLIFFRLIHLY